MKLHVKIYLQEMGYETTDYIPCEIGRDSYVKCLGKATDVHHIDARGMGGRKSKDVIENLMGLCRRCHDDFGDIKDFKPYLKRIHLLRLENR